MNCEEFEIIGLDLERSGAARSETGSAERAAAMEHALECPRCSALREAWVRAQAELQVLRIATQNAEAPPRLEMRLLQDFRRNHRVVKPRTARIASWAFATAAVLALTVSWWNWRATRHDSPVPVASNHGANSGNSAANGSATDRSPSENSSLIADNDGDFTLLPGSLPQETDDAAIVRVRLQRGALEAFGLPVNQERAGEWLQVDLLVGEDGQPRAVRVPTSTAAN